MDLPRFCTLVHLPREVVSDDDFDLDFFLQQLHADTLGKKGYVPHGDAVIDDTMHLLAPDEQWVTFMIRSESAVHWRA